jgi:hypothetical protein
MILVQVVSYLKSGMSFCFVPLPNVVDLYKIPSSILPVTLLQQYKIKSIDTALYIERYSLLSSGSVLIKAVFLKQCDDTF